MYNIDPIALAKLEYYDELLEQVLDRRAERRAKLFGEKIRKVLPIRLRDNSSYYKLVDTASQDDDNDLESFANHSTTSPQSTIDQQENESHQQESPMNINDSIIVSALEDSMSAFSETALFDGFDDSIMQPRSTTPVNGEKEKLISSRAGTQISVSIESEDLLVNDQQHQPDQVQPTSPLNINDSIILSALDNSVSEFSETALFDGFDDSLLSSPKKSSDASISPVIRENYQSIESNVAMTEPHENQETQENRDSDNTPTLSFAGTEQRASLIETESDQAFIVLDRSTTDHTDSPCISTASIVSRTESKMKRPFSVKHPDISSSTEPSVKQSRKDGRVEKMEVVPSRKPSTLTVPSSTVQPRLPVFVPLQNRARVLLKPLPAHSQKPDDSQKRQLMNTQLKNLRTKAADCNSTHNIIARRLPNTNIAKPSCKQEAVNIVEPANIHDSKILMRLFNDNIVNLEKLNYIEITVGEIRRRCASPEYFDVDMLLRLLKKTESSRYDLIKVLHNCQISVVLSRMRTNQTKLAHLYEATSRSLALDFAFITKSCLDSAFLAKVIAAAASPRIDQLRSCVHMIKQYLMRVKVLVECAGLEPRVFTQKEGRRPEFKAVKSFGLLTHGLGPLTTSAILQSLINALNHLYQHPPSVRDITEMVSPLALDNSESSFGIAKDLLLVDPLENVRFGTISEPRIDKSTPIKITVGEIRRRVCGPEKFKLCNVFTYLKLPNGQRGALKRDLNAFGINVNHRGETHLTRQTSSWSSITEHEAASLARETSHYLQSIPVPLPDPSLEEWISMIVKALSELMDRISAENTAKSQSDLVILRYSLLSHNFGQLYYKSVLKWIEPKKDSAVQR